MRQVVIASAARTAIRDYIGNIEDALFAVIVF
jgi:hypothetical protein